MDVGVIGVEWLGKVYERGALPLAGVAKREATQRKDREDGSRNGRKVKRLSP